MKTKNKNNKRSWIQYGILGVLGIVLYTTGLHTEVIGFAQRGLLATGLMNPNVEDIALARTTHSAGNSLDLEGLPKADFNLPLIDRAGNRTSLEAMKGKVIFINFWATWCPPCIAEMPSIDKLHEEMKDEVAFVLLSFDDDFEKAKSFDDKKGYNLPIYAPGGGLPAMYQSRALPTTYVIDAKGNLALTHKGMADYNAPEFKTFLNSLK